MRVNVQNKKYNIMYSDRFSSAMQLVLTKHAYFIPNVFVVWVMSIKFATPNVIDVLSKLLPPTPASLLLTNTSTENICLRWLVSEYLSVLVCTLYSVSVYLSVLVCIVYRIVYLYLSVLYSVLVYLSVFKCTCVYTVQCISVFKCTCFKVCLCSVL